MKSFGEMEIKDRQSFIEFLMLFRKDLNSNPGGWENKNLDDFLEAMAHYTEDIQGYYDNCKKEIGEHINADIPSWRTFAEHFERCKSL
jgi:hypothetical protein